MTIQPAAAAFTLFHTQPLSELKSLTTEITEIHREHNLISLHSSVSSLAEKTSDFENKTFNHGGHGDSQRTEPGFPAFLCVLCGKKPFVFLTIYDFTIYQTLFLLSRGVMVR
jgi:hypothetical protein